MWGRIVREFGIDMYTLLFLKWITDKDLLYTTVNVAQCYMVAWKGGEFGRKWIHVCVWLSPFAVHLKLSKHGQLAILQYKIKKNNIVDLYSNICSTTLLFLMSVLFSVVLFNNPPGSSVHGIFQVRILDWVAVSFAKCIV